MPFMSQTVAKGEFNSTNTYSNGLYEIDDAATLTANTAETISGTYTLSYNEPKNESEAFVNEIHGLYGSSTDLTIRPDEEKLANSSINIFGLFSAGYSFYRPRKHWSYYIG